MLRGANIADTIQVSNLRNMAKVRQECYRRLAESAQDYIFIIDKNLTVQYINSFASKQLGIPVQDIVGRPLDCIFPPHIVTLQKQRLQNVIFTGESFASEDYVEFNGHSFWLHTKLMPVTDFAGNVSAVMGFARDITERKVMEESLKENDRFLSSIFSSIQDGLSILDLNLNILRVNPTMEKWYAHAGAIVGLKCYEAYHGRTAPCEECPSQQTIKTKETACKVVPMRGAGGKVVGWQDLYSFPFFDEKTGQLKGVIEYVRDISGRVKAEEELTKRQNKLEEVVAELMNSNRLLKALSLRDPQTHLFNHRYLGELLEAEFQRSKRYSYPFALMMIDIDYFKSINDVYGHPFGDLVLRQFAAKLKRTVRKYDVLARYSGEEFIVVSPAVDRLSALNFAQRIHDAVTLSEFGNDEHKVKLKITIAVVAYPQDECIKSTDLIELADTVLNNAKECGGNKVFSTLDTENGKLPAEEEGKADVHFLQQKISKLTRSANQSLVEAIFAFAKTIEVKDHYTGEHVERTVSYATQIAKAVKLSLYDVDLIRQAAMLHDLGKIGISEKVLFKPGRLTKAEFEEIKKHPQIGVDIIRPIHFLHPIIPYILHHHERWNGSGYPFGLKGEDIPMGARIVAIADVYQALISNRSYRKALSKKQAIDILKDGAGTLFDPQLISAFFTILSKERK